MIAVNNENDKATPLMFAVAVANIESVKIILKHLKKDKKKLEKHINAQDNMGMTAMHIAASSNENMILALLDKHGADASIQNAAGQNVFDLCILNLNKDGLEYLLRISNKYHDLLFLKRGLDKHIQGIIGGDLIPQIAEKHQ